MAINPQGAVGGAAQGASAGASVGGVPGAVVGGAVGLASGLLGGGSQQTTSGYTLPPEYEIQYFQQFQQQMQYLQSAYQQVSQLTDVYNQRANAAYGAMQGTIPSSQATQLLTQTSSQLAQALGMSASDMVKNGYITSAEQPALQKMQDIATQGTNYRGDAVTEQNIADQKRQLQQQLAREGVPAAQQQIALQQFDVSAGQQRQQAAQAQLGNLGGYLSSASGLQQQNYNQAVGGLGAIQGQLGYTQQGIGQLGQMAGNQFGQQQGALNMQLGLGQQQLGNYQQMGQFQFSDTAKAGLASGLYGKLGIAPGSIYQQTGVAASAFGDYNNWAQTQQRLNTTGQIQNGYITGNQNLTPQNYQNFKGYQGNQTPQAFAGVQNGATGVAVNRTFQQG